MKRVVSLLPSTTEIVHALGCGEQLVGRSHECDHPDGVEILPVVTEPRVPIEGASLRIDRQLRSILEQALSVYRVHTDVLAELAPHVVLTQSLCQVCAVGIEDVQAAVDGHLGATTEVVALEPRLLDDVVADFRRVARALEVPTRGEQLTAAVTGRIEGVRRRTRDLPVRTVVSIEWIDPLMSAGNWMPELVDAAGGRELFGTAGAHSPWITWEQIRDADPEVIVILPCGFDLERTRTEAASLRALPGWTGLRAVREGRVAITDGHRYFNRPGPRLADSTEILAEILHPGRFTPRHRGTGWEPFADR